MTGIKPDSVMGHPAALLEGETVLDEFRADHMAYWRGHLIMAVVLGAVAGIFLLWQGNPYPFAGPLGTTIAIALRGLYLASEALSDVWRLTDRRLLGPGGRAIPLAQLKIERPLLGAVQIVTVTGDMHLIKYQADATATVARIKAVVALGKRKHP